MGRGDAYASLERSQTHGKDRPSRAKRHGRHVSIYILELRTRVLLTIDIRCVDTRHACREAIDDRRFVPSLSMYANSHITQRD